MKYQTTSKEIPFQISILFIALFFSSGLAAQFNQLKNYNVKDGLPSSDVYAMLQSKSGYMWFTSDMGVSRFDGYEFKNYTTENGLADNTNFGLEEDSKSRIWFRSFSGRLSYFENEKIKTPECNSGILKLLGTAAISSLYVDEGDTIWLGLNFDRLLKISPPWKKENMINIEIKSKGAYLILFSENKFIYGGSSPEKCDLTVYDNHLKKSYVIPTQLDPIAKGYIRFTYTMLKDHTYAFMANNVITRFDAHGLISQKTNSSTFICLLEEENKTFLAGTYDGVKQFSNYSFDDGGAFSNLDKKVITALCHDHENGLWICTEGNGIFYIPFRNFLYYAPINGLSESKISCVAKAGRKVFCGHLDGTISILSKQTVKSLHFNPDTTCSSSANRATSIAYNGNEELYISTIKNVFTYNLTNNSFITNLPTGSKMIIPSEDQGIWSLSFNNLVKYYPGQSFKKANNVRLDFYSDNLFEDRSGKVWICPTNSVWTYDTTAGLQNAGKDIPMLNSRIVDVKEDVDGNMWMVSRGSGVIIKKGNSYYNITQINGLAGNMCRTLFIDSGNVVWVGTNNGLSKIEMDQGNEFKYKIKSYSSKNGLLTNEVNNILRQDNKLWLVHNNGISVFDPTFIGDNTNTPPVYITSLLVNNDTLSTESELNFSYDRNYFNISFIGLSYKDPGKLEYRYKLEGVDSIWNYTNYTSIKYQTLPPGKYRFLVFAKNNDGYWSSKPATLSFIILPAWWQTWIFKIAVLITIVILILLFFRFRLGVIRKRDEKKSILQNRIAGIELNALRAQMNPHFVFNSINSVQYFITNNDPDSSQKYLSKFAKLIRYVVDNSKLTLIALHQELEALTLYLDLEALRFGKRFEYSININKNVDVDYIQVPSMLIQPYVENSIWHGIMHKEGDGKITISLEMQQEVLKCTIEDNGIGRQKSKEIKLKQNLHSHNSIGMSNTKERLDIINHVTKSNMHVKITDLQDEKGEASGTRVEIYIPSGFIS